MVKRIESLKKDKGSYFEEVKRDAFIMTLLRQVNQDVDMKTSRDYYSFIEALTLTVGKASREIFDKVDSLLISKEKDKF